MLRFGYYAHALRRIAEVLQPPIPLPRFPAPPPLTVEDMRRAICSTPNTLQARMPGRMPSRMSMSAAAGD